MPARHLWFLILGLGGHILASHFNAVDAAEFYDPVERQVEGWTVVVDPQLLSGEHKETGSRAIEALANHLQRVKYILPEERARDLQRVRIWIELDNSKLG